tara:strand:- start:25 stop:750 length:726 start_codon:yes stop_codon:yes gene_type:complete
MKYAIYRIHYGLDFLEQSVNSIYDHVDRIFIFWSHLPWYKGCTNLPPLNENVTDFCDKKFGLEKVFVYVKEFDLPDNQYKIMYDQVVKDHGRPWQTLMMEPDMVWGEDINKIWDIKDKETSFKQIEFWKSEEWYVPRQKPRPGPTLYNGEMGKTNKGCWSNPHAIHPDYSCYNYGFCLTPEVMKYRCEVLLQSSKYYRDSQPSPVWYEQKWLNWTPETEDLEISENYKHYIKKALPWVSQR